jgi:hypothetical protein
MNGTGWCVDAEGVVAVLERWARTMQRGRKTPELEGDDGDPRNYPMF